MTGPSPLTQRPQIVSRRTRPSNRWGTNVCIEQGIFIGIENVFTPLVYEVYDRDVVGSDDFKGRAEFDLTSLVTLYLEDGGDEDLIRKNKKGRTLGYITVRMTLSTLTKEEYNEVG